MIPKRGEPLVISEHSLNQQGVLAYQSEVMHQRLRPFTYVFRYNIMSVCLDIDVFCNRTEPLSWLSFNRFGLMSIHTKDFGSRDGQNWRNWLTDLLAQYGLSQPANRILLSCIPRCLGYGFNPLAMWYAYDDQERLIAVVAEVSNTFGHFHHYVFANGGKPIEIKAKSLRFMANKAFHVSPFLNMQCAYHFAIRPPSASAHTPISISIKETEDAQDTLVATQNARPIALPSNRLGLLRLGHWLSSFKTIAAIHWWALKIVLKGGKFHRTPKAQLEQPYAHSPLVLESR